MMVHWGEVAMENSKLSCFVKKECIVCACTGKREDVDERLNPREFM